MTRQRGAEAALRSVKEELDTVLNAVSGALFRYLLGEDGDPRIVYVSDSIEAITGFAPAECMMPNWLKARRDPAFDPSVRKHFQRLMDPGQFHRRIPPEAQGREWLWCEVFAHAVGRDEPLTVVGCLRDITRERERNQQTAHSAKMAVLGEMTTGFAEELSHPLAAISLAARTRAIRWFPANRTIASLTRSWNGLSSRRSEPLQWSIICGFSAAPRGFRRRPFRLPRRSTAPGRSLDFTAAGVPHRVADRYRTGAAAISGHLLPLEQVLTNLLAMRSMQSSCKRPLWRTTGDASRSRPWRMASRLSSALRITPAALRRALPRLFEPFFTTKPTGVGNRPRAVDQLRHSDRHGRHRHRA